MALEDLFRRMGFRRDPSGTDITPASIQFFTGSGHGEYRKPTRQELAKYPGLEKYPQALKYLSSIGISLADIQAVYPQFEDFAESEFDDHGRAFMYVDGPYKDYRLDRVLFPTQTEYPYILAADRATRYSPHRGRSLGAYNMPKRRIRMNVYPDTSISLQLQTATHDDLTDMATFFIDPDGTVDYSERTMRNSHFLYDESRSYEERPVPQRLATVTDPAAQQAIPYFSQEYLEQYWDLTEDDIAIPSAELAASILTAPAALGIDLKAMIDY